MTARPKLSLVVCCYKMKRELPRTLLSLARPYQRDIDDLSYEVVVVDNGSPEPPIAEDFAALDLDLTVIRSGIDNPSPVHALNMGIAACRGERIGVLIDGARMASPRLVAAAERALDLHPRAIVFTQSLQLGHQPQWLAAQTGYNQTVEDDLLASIDWPENGYRLFNIASWPRERRGFESWLEPCYESNALFMPRVLWEESGGYDPRFRTAGGGMASHDLFARACDLPGTQLVKIVGEATFHQFHGDSASSSHPDAPNQLKAFTREYAALGKARLRPVTRPAWTLQITPQSDMPLVDTVPDHRLESRYETLLKQVILNETGLELEARLSLMLKAGAPQADAAAVAAMAQRLARERESGYWRDTLPESLSMIGRKRLDQLAKAVATVLEEGIAGDLMECGVWRGGACLLMAGMLAERGIRGRSIILADSFCGFPKRGSQADQSETGDFWDRFSNEHREIAVTEAEVRATFERFGLLGPDVRFLSGWFSETLPRAPVERLALLRLDGDTFGATEIALDRLYDKLSPGGFLIVDDYNIPECRAAVSVFRERHKIRERIARIDWTGIFWRKGHLA